jgi:hypothetical protein
MGKQRQIYECDCCGRRNVPAKLKGIGYVCDDCLTSWTWDYGRYRSEEDPLNHWPVCPFGQYDQRGVPPGVECPAQEPAGRGSGGRAVGG